MTDLNKRIESADMEELKRLEARAAAQRTEALFKLKELIDSIGKLKDKLQ